MEVSMNDDGAILVADVTNDDDSSDLDLESGRDQQHTSAAAIRQRAMTVRTSSVEAPSRQAQSCDQQQHISAQSRITLRDWVKVVKLSDSFSAISIEQLERVKIMHDRFAEGTELCFNYYVLLMVASILAGFGLASNSSSTIIASMLVSPIMGPVVAMAYGSTIMDWKLVKKSIKVELLSLLFCCLSGFCIAAICGPTHLADQWPTHEMLIRGDMQNFFVGVPVAFFSGLGVAVSLMDQQTSSLVGVAISASLLPPAVNSGMMIVAYAFTEHDILGTATPLPATTPNPVGGVDDDTFEEVETFADYSRSAFISIGLTLSNILIVWFASMLMFRIKEVLPIHKTVFWTDLGIARKIYQGQAFMHDERAHSKPDEEKPTESYPDEGTGVLHCRSSTSLGYGRLNISHQS